MTVYKSMKILSSVTANFNNYLLNCIGKLLKYD
jgi:hypothetical protein